MTYLIAILLILFIAFGIYKAGKLSASGALSGVVVAVVIFLDTRYRGLLVLLVFFTLGTLASSWKKKEKQEQGFAQENEGARTWKNVLANMGIAATISLSCFIFNLSEIWQASMVAAVASATADTVASETGNITGSRYVNITTLKQGVRGVDGSVSIEGTLAAALASIFIAAIWQLSGSGGYFTLIAVAGIIGSLADSVLGATLQQKGILNNHSVNFWSTLIASVVFLSLAHLSAFI